MWPRFQRGHPLLLDRKTRRGAAGANATGTATSRQGDGVLHVGPQTKALVEMDGRVGGYR